MIQTVTVDVINDHAMQLLLNLELLDLIHVHKAQTKLPNATEVALAGQDLARFRGMPTPERAAEFQEYVRKSRAEWDSSTEQIAISAAYWTERYKGAMSKQPIDDIEQQLTSLRNEWE
jgi:hypothetical protein